MRLSGGAKEQSDPGASTSSKDPGARPPHLPREGLPDRLDANKLQEDKVLFVLMICDPVDQRLTAQG